MTKKAYWLKWTLSFIFLYLLTMGAYIGYNVKNDILSFSFPQQIQKNYAKYLIKQNDKFVDYMLEFEELLNDSNREYTKEELKTISDNIVRKNRIMEDIQRNPPNENNDEYSELYKDILKVYAFFIQGDVMRVEYISAYKEEYTPEEISSGLQANEESYVMGVQLSNMMGSVILENPNIINRVKNTNIKSKYQTKPLQEWIDSIQEVDVEESNN